MESAGMTEYQIDANTCRCAVSGRELKSGERFYSVLLVQAGKLRRMDYSSEVWQGPPDGTFSFWTGRIPLGDQARLPRVDEETLVDCFQRLENETEPGRVRFRYVLALLLMRRKRLKFEETRKASRGAITPGDPNRGALAPEADDQDFISLRCNRTGQVYRVVDPQMTDEEMAAVQQEVLGVLGWQ
jgi:hypothetical protein